MAAEKQLIIKTLMAQSGVGFGTSGARGLVTDMTDEVCYAYTRAFLQHLESQRLLSGGAVAIGGDLRPSTGRIMAAVALAVSDAGYRPIHAGRVPSPALAYFGIVEQIPTVMVTGSHIPDDRNGIKFNRPDGEILKEDERGISEQQVSVPHGRFGAHGEVLSPFDLGPVESQIHQGFVRRYLDFFPKDCLRGLRIGVYEHSTVIRDTLGEIFRGLGAEVTSLGRSEQFIPVDTEAVRPEDIELARHWAADCRFDAIVSADGDGDRPLISDEQGQWLRGDVVGVLCASYLKAQRVVTPVSSNTLVEKSRLFEHVTRTRIGSPFVIEGMKTALETATGPVAGYEANGGFLLASDVSMGNARLTALPTRDCVLPMLAVLLLSRQQGSSISALLKGLPQRYTASDRLKAFPVERSRQLLEQLRLHGNDGSMPNIDAMLGSHFGKTAFIDETDGLRITLESGEIVHFRPSGNAPEFRCYTEADSEFRAQEMNKQCLRLLESMRG